MAQKSNNSAVPPFNQSAWFRPEQDDARGSMSATDALNRKGGRDTEADAVAILSQVIDHVSQTNKMIFELAKSLKGRG